MQRACSVLAGETAKYLRHSVGGWQFVEEVLLVGTGTVELDVVFLP